VSKNVSATGIGFNAIKLEIGGQATAVLSYARKQLSSAGRLLDLEKARSRNINLDVVAFLEAKRFHYWGGQADSQAISPFTNLHADA
jgi:hypothetical protein